jgi:hypothetical protein
MEFWMIRWLVSNEVEIPWNKVMVIKLENQFIHLTNQSNNHSFNLSYPLLKESVCTWKLLHIHKSSFYCDDDVMVRVSQDVENFFQNTIMLEPKDLTVSYFQTLYSL